MSGQILVTGATGFVGSRLTKALVERGESVKVLVRPGSSLRALEGLPANSFKVVRGDILSEDDVFRALVGCDRLFHVAAVYKMYAKDPRQVLEPAIEGTKNVLEAVLKHGQVDKVVVTSSVAAVGVNSKPEPMDETWEFNLKAPATYIQAKRKSEELVFSYVEAHGLPLVVVNPSGIFGPGDWKPTPSGKNILQFLNWRLPIPMNVITGGLNIVDVDDVVEGHLLAMEKGRVGQRYILGGEDLTYEHMYSILGDVSGLKERVGKPISKSMAMTGAKLMEALARVSSFEPPASQEFVRDYVGNYVWVSSKKAEEQLGYQHRSAMKTLDRSVRWYERHGYVKAS